MYLGLNSVLRASGHPRKSMYATIYTVVINAALDPREERRSFTFWVAPVGTPPHLRKRFQISALYAACLLYTSRCV